MQVISPSSADNNCMKTFELCRDLFVERLKEAIDGKSIAIFSKFVGIPDRTINSWVRKITTPNMEYIIRLAQKLGCSAGYLLGLED